MANRIICIPDAQNIIKISCGGDLLEIEVAFPLEMPFDGQHQSQPRQTQPITIGKIEHGTIKPPDPFGNPYAFSVKPGVDDDGRINISGLFAQIVSSHDSNRSTHASEFIINMDQPVNLHDAVKLSHGIEGISPGARLALNFGSGNDD